MTWTQKCVVRIFQSKFIYVYVFCGGGGVTMYLSAQRNVSQDVNIQQTTEEVSNLAVFTSIVYPTSYTPLAFLKIRDHEACQTIQASAPTSYRVCLESTRLFCCFRIQLS